MREIAGLLVVAVLVALGAPVLAQPVPPCPPGMGAPLPAYADVGSPPAVQTWRDIDLDDRTGCLGGLKGRMALVVALAVRFDGTRTLADIAARIGAVSETTGLPYWSVTDRDWRPLISDSFAVDDPVRQRRRPDFSAEEVLSGRTLYFAQNDTRSTGVNIYSMTARSVETDRFVIDIANLTAIRFALITLFEPQDLRSIHFIDRLERGTWGYYGISAVRDGAVKGHEKSFVNRAGAFYRFMIGSRADQAPPLAP